MRKRLLSVAAPLLAALILGGPALAAAKATTVSPAHADALKSVRPTASAPVGPLARCVAVEYSFSCLNGQPVRLTKTACPPGSVGDTCCTSMRQRVAQFCAPQWQKAYMSGQPWVPGIFLCHCIPSAGN